VFESIQVAATLLELDERRLADCVRTSSTHNGITWSRLEHATPSAIENGTP
jgi:hypothetical protein